MWLSAQWQTALVSAITAAIVTVAVEYAIRPRLEARKDRAVTIAKTIQTLQASLMDLLIDTEYLTSKNKDVSLAMFTARLRHCEQAARMIAVRQRHWRRIRDVLNELQASRRLLDPFQKAPTAHPASGHTYEEFHDGLAHLYRAASRLLYRRGEVVEMIDLLRKDLRELLSSTDSFWGNKEHVDARRVFVDACRCEHQTRVIAAHRRGRDRIHRVLSALQSSRRQLERSLIILSTSSSDHPDREAVEEAFQDFHNEVNRFVFPRKSHERKWLDEQMRQRPSKVFIG